MLNRISLVTICAVLVGLFASSTAMAGPTDRDPIPPPTDYWQDRGFMLMAHQGGEWDFPPNTLYAYKKAIEIGADMIDMDAYVTADGEIVLTHDLRAADNSNAPNDSSHDINDLTLAELKEYDFAYKWRPRGSSDDPPFRGIATGDVPPPAGFTANDFRIPSFAEVLDAFPDTPINIEMKQVSGVDIEDTAAELADLLETHPGHDENVIINSFGQEMLDAVHAARPEHLSFGGSQDATIAYLEGTPITPTPVALEPPDLFQLLDPPLPATRTVPILKPGADHDGYQIYVWGSDKDPEQDTDPFYARLIAEGADSYNTPSPTRLAEYLCENGIADPDGNPRCAEQICPEGQTGIAPDNCVDVPVDKCPEGQVGTPPNCVPPPCPPKLEYGTGPCQVNKKSKVSKLSFVKKKGKNKAGKKSKLVLKVKATPGIAIKAKVLLKSSSRKVKLPKFVMVKLKPGATVKKTITLRSTKKAKGMVRITASSGGAKANVNPLYEASGQAGNNPLHTD